MTRVVEQTAQRMLIRSRPGPGLKVVLWLALAAYVWFVCPSHVLRCRRMGENRVEIRAEERLLGFLRSSRVIPDVRSATVEMNPRGTGGQWERRSGRHGSQTTFVHDDTSRIVFQTAHGSVLLTRAYTTGQEGFREAAAAVNRFVQSTESTSVVVPVPSHWMIWLGAGFLAFVAIGVVFSRGTDCEIDRVQGVVRITRPGIGGRKVVEYRLTEVERFSVIEHVRRWARKRFGRSHQQIEYTVGLRTMAGEEVSVTSESGTFGLEAMEAMAARLERFRIGRRD